MQVGPLTQFQWAQAWLGVENQAHCISTSAAAVRRGHNNKNYNDDDDDDVGNGNDNDDGATTTAAMTPAVWPDGLTQSSTTSTKK